MKRYPLIKVGKNLTLYWLRAINKMSYPLRSHGVSWILNMNIMRLAFISITFTLGWETHTKSSEKLKVLCKTTGSSPPRPWLSALFYQRESCRVQCCVRSGFVYTSPGSSYRPVQPAIKRISTGNQTYFNSQSNVFQLAIKRILTNQTYFNLLSYELWRIISMPRFFLLRTPFNWYIISA
jgi:hypothetical protein